jgi:hypothetical protein
VCRSFDTDPSTGNDDDGSLLLGSKTGVITTRLSCLYSNWSPNSWASPTFSTTTNVQSLDILDAETESLSTMGLCPSFNNSNSISYTSDSNTPLSWEGTLSFRKSRSSPRSSAWKPVYVVLNLMDGGSLTCVREKPQFSEQNPYLFGSKKICRRQRRRTLGDTRPQFSGSSLLEHVSDLVQHHQHHCKHGNTKANLRFHLGTRIGWIAKDIQRSESQFTIEIPHKELTGLQEVIREISEEETNKATGSKPYRLYFQCARNSVEKALWLRALERIDRLSHDLHSKRGVQSFFDSNINVKHRRMRNNLSSQLAREGTAILCHQDSILDDDPGFKNLCNESILVEKGSMWYFLCTRIRIVG